MHATSGAKHEEKFGGLIRDIANNPHTVPAELLNLYELGTRGPAAAVKVKVKKEKNEKKSRAAAKAAAGAKVRSTTTHNLQ